jgi:hypothetical protein
MQFNKTRFLKLASLILLFGPYLLYIRFIIRADQGPVDYETFMSIGGRLLSGGVVYGENSYYPMPYVMLFALFSWLPRPLSMVLWLLGPVVAALAITRGNPLVLLFAPLFGHFAGGQSAVFGMLGLWGYRKFNQTDRTAGGVFLALTLLKPQLGIIPLAFAAWQWWQVLRGQRRIPRQAWAWAVSMLVLYLPGFLVMPDWPLRWLSTPRPLFERALSGFVPRSLLYVLSPEGTAFWVTLAVIAALLLYAAWRLHRKTLTLDLAVAWSFVVSPLVHDYDLIQLIPLLDRPFIMKIAVLLSIPGWLVILFAYTNNTAWYAFTIIAPGILAAMLY